MTMRWTASSAEPSDQGGFVSWSDFQELQAKYFHTLDSLKDSASWCSEYIRRLEALKTTLAELSR
jgi:hypothetical protein